MSDLQYQNVVDPSLLTTNLDDSAIPGSIFDEIYPFGIPESDFADAPQADALLNFDKFDFDPKTTDAIDGGCSIPFNSEMSFPQDQRYVSLPSQSHSHPRSVWRPVGPPAKQLLQYPDPVSFTYSQRGPRPCYYRPIPPSANTMMQHQYGAITPPGQQISSLDQSLFLHGHNMSPSHPASAATIPYVPIPNYQDDGTFNPEDLALSDIPDEIPDDILVAAINDTWTLPPDYAQQSSSSSSSEPFISTRKRNRANAADLDYTPDYAPESDESYRPPPKKARRARGSRPSRILPNGEVKKGRPCAKPQTEERLRVNQRRMEGYYRRKYDQGNLEKTRLQSKESYWRRKERRIAAGEKLRSYNTAKNEKR